MKINEEKKLREIVRNSLLKQRFLAEEEDETKEEENDEEPVDVENEEEPTDDESIETEFSDDEDFSSEEEGDSSDILQGLEQALEAARSLGDEKLINQIGNTITFYTRSHIVKGQGMTNQELEEDEDFLDEELTRWNKIAGLR